MSAQGSLADHRPDLENRPMPVSRDAFLGREQETRDLLKLLARPDLACLTVLGPGGVGKTRLMTQVAEQLAHDRREPFPDGIWFVPLATVTDPNRVPMAVAHVLDLELGDEPASATVVEFLRERETLLILDNLEQVIEAAPFVAEIAAECCDVKIVVTSRRPLRINGEQEYILAPLPLPDVDGGQSTDALEENPAVALFIQRARKVNPHIQFDERALAQIAEICRALDGLPLAIELAGARTKALSPSALVTQLGNRLRVLTGGPRDAPSRQQTLRSAIAWSYDILRPEEQRLFRHLAVFTGSFSLSMVEALEGRQGERGKDGQESTSPHPLTPSPPLLDLISNLVDHSLTQAVETDLDDPRWRMLQTIQEFSRESLAAAGEEQPLCRAHAVVVADLAARAEVGFYGKDQADWLKRLTAEEANIRAALEWSLVHDERELSLRIAGSIWRFWSLRHAGNEGRRWLARALAAPGDVSQFALGIGYRGTGCLAEDVGDYETAERSHRQALAVWEELGDQQRRARSLDDLGNVAHDQGDFPRAIELHNQAYEVAKAAGDRRFMASARANLGSAYFLQGNIVAARDEWQGVLDSNTIDDPVSRAMVMNNLAAACLQLGDLDQARSILENALVIHQELGTLTTRADVYVNLSDVATRQGERERARVLFEQGIELYRLAEDPKGLHSAYFNLGIVQIDAGDPRAALTSFEEALRFADRATNRMGIADGIDRIASLAIGTNLAESAAALAGAAQAIRDRAGAPGIPAHHAFAAQLHKELRNALSVTTYEAAFAEGRELSPRQATARAFELSARLADTERVAVNVQPAAVAPPQVAPSEAGTNPFRLTKREIEVLRLLSEGRTDREIAAALFISPRTANSHVTNIFGKMGVDSRAAAVAAAFRKHLI